MSKNVKYSANHVDSIYLLEDISSYTVEDVVPDGEASSATKGVALGLRETQNKLFLNFASGCVLVLEPVLTKVI